MPRKSAGFVPKYRWHRTRDLAVVTIAGKDHYLGPYKSKASYLEYDRLIAEWLAAGRPSSSVESNSSSVTVSKLILESARIN